MGAGPLSWSSYADVGMATYLDRILVAHRVAAQADRRDYRALIERAEACPPARNFAEALRAGSSKRGNGGAAVIAEIKRRSPSKGPLAPELIPGVLAKAYCAAGASCLSVLTDSDFFGGSVADLVEAREAVAIPVLRKDFTVCGADICDARLMGADAVLLIVGALSATQLSEFLGLCSHLGFGALVEVHDEDEAARALAAGARIVGVNQRDLVTFEVDTDRAVRVAEHLPGDVTRVAESGIRTAEDVRRLAGAGFDAVLVGEALVTAPDPGAALEALLTGEAT
jgi:indole-3-glycerol phosphate synthase